MMPSPIVHIWIKLFCLHFTSHTSHPTKPCMEAGTLPKNYIASLYVHGPPVSMRCYKILQVVMNFLKLP